MRVSSNDDYTNFTTFSLTFSITLLIQKEGYMNDAIQGIHSGTIWEVRSSVSRNSQLIII